MKKLFTNLAVLLFIPALYFVFISAFTKPENTKNVNTVNESTVSNTVSTDTTKFINMIMNLDHRCGDELWVKENVDRYKDSLGFNSVHVYPLDELEYGKFPEPLSSKQRGNIVDLINTVQNKNLKFFYEHAFFSYLCFAQRLVYEVPTANGDISANYGFCYRNTSVAPSTDSTRTVLYSPASSNHQETLLCDSIYENVQHSDFFSRQHDDTTWFLKPMVRANLRGVQSTTPVFKIEIYSFDHTKIDERIIYAYNFEPSSNNYDSSYIDRFYDVDHSLMNITFRGDTLTGINKGKGANLLDCKVDFKIYTYGYVDFWFDKLTVDDFYANKLFDPLSLNNYDNRITELLDAVSTETNVYSLYMDELTYSQLPCTKYVMNKIDAYNENTGKDIKFMVSESNWMNLNKTRSKSLGHKPMLTLLQPRAVNIFSYEFFHFGDNDVSSYVPSFAFDSVNFRIPNGWKTNNYNTYNNALQNNIFGHKNAASGGGIHDWGTFIYQVDLAKRNIKDYSPHTLLYLNPQEYGEMWINEGENTFKGIIEPTNEEGGAQLMLSLAHGAQGFMWYIFQTIHPVAKDTYIKRNPNLQFNDNISEYFILGLYGENDYAEKRRISNIYGQNKWEYYKKLNQKINNWIPTLDKIKWDNGFSVHQDGVENYYIKDIKSIFRDYTGVFSDGPSCLNCDNVKYWEEGFFNPTDNNDLSKYFLMINRRCVPEVAGIHAGDIRQLKIKFKASELAGFNNWILKDVNTGQEITFDKNNQSTDGFLDLGFNEGDMGRFQPGEGKLFQLAPVMQEGGTFVCDEQVINKSFECKAPVHTGGYKLELLSQNSGQTTVTFKPGAQIVGEIGNEIWIWGTNNNHVRLIGNNWLGIYANDLDYLNMEYVDIENVSAAWAISAYNCITTKIDYCVLTLAESKRAINVNNTNEPDATIAVYNNTITASNSYYTVFFGSSAGSSNTLFFWDNTINSSSLSQIGVFLLNINYSDVSGNHISGFNTGLKLLNCSLDLTSNTIENSGDNSIGIDCFSSSTINMGLIGNGLNAQNNKIVSHGSQCKNISLDNSTFQMDYGSNNLQVDIGSGSYNMYGYGDFVINDDGPILYIEAKNNCFNLNGNMAIHHLTNPNGGLFSLHEIPHNCLKPRDLIVDFVQPLTESLIDTVYRTTDSAYQNLSVAKTLYQNLYLNLIKKNYDSTIIIGFNLLTNFAESTNSTDIISKLYYSTSRIDSTGQNVTALKTFYEQLILNNTQNVMLVKSANYYIQKCKVQLEQYTSALDGFQDIMVQNPYSYEGVLASWDYAATLLLANSSGGYSNNVSEYTELNEINAENEYLIDTLRINKFARNDKYDKKTFTTDDRKQFFKSVGNVLKDERSKQIEKVKTLEEKFTKADDKEKSKLQIQITDAKNINSVVKIKRPKDDNEYQAIVNNDIEKLNPKKETGNSGINNLIPTTYALYQNYPNPFNPTTKIAYDIPKDAKVKLVIYDILGREVKMLVNNEFRSAGKYITEFNGSYLASGVYFARILVNDGKEFMAVKKLVLLK